MGCSTEAAATRTLAEACCEPLYSFTRLARKSRSSFWLSLRPSLYREGLIREARDVWGSLSSGCGVRSGSGSLKNSQLYNIYYKKSLHSITRILYSKVRKDQSDSPGIVPHRCRYCIARLQLDTVWF